MDDQLEAAAVAQADRRDVTHVARGQATDAESLGERDDRAIHKPETTNTWQRRQAVVPEAAERHAAQGA